MPVSCYSVGLADIEERGRRGQCAIPHAIGSIATSILELHQESAVVNVARVPCKELAYGFSFRVLSVVHDGRGLTADIGQLVNHS